MDDKPRVKVAPELQTPIDLAADASRKVCAALNHLVADTFVLYLKTKNFHWHVSGPHFRDYHLLLDEQAEQMFATIDDLAERVRKIGGTTLRSVGHISELATLPENNRDFVAPHEMLTELITDHKKLIAEMREAHGVASDADDVATTSLLETVIDGAERRLWFLFETTRK
jgi:starvation-inducible DNA-binding protein